MSLVAVGACYLDTILTTPHYPGEDEKLRASSISRRRGGNCPNSLEVLRQLTNHSPSTAGVSLDLIAVLPSKSSVASQQIRSALEPHVNLEHCIYREQFEEPASSYIIKSDASGSRTIVNYNELPEMNVEEFKRIADALGPKSTWFHFEGRIPDVTLACIRYLREKFPSVTISAEVEKPQRQGLQELAVEADVVFYSKSWALGNGYNSAEECIREQSRLTRNAKLLFCTWGEQGACGLETQNGKFEHVLPFGHANLKVVDTIGAGDTFIAGMLYAMICPQKYWGLAQNIGFGNWVAGMKISQEGFSDLGRSLNMYMDLKK